MSFTGTRPGAGLPDRERRDIDPEHIKATLGQPNCIRSPVPAPISSVRDVVTAPEVTNSTHKGSGFPVSQGSSPEARLSFHDLCGITISVLVPRRSAEKLMRCNRCGENHFLMA